MDEGKLRDQQRRGARAEALLKDDLLQAAFSELRQSLLHSWETTAAGQTEERERTWLSLRLLEKIKSMLETHVTTGNLAARQIAMMEPRKKPT